MLHRLGHRLLGDGVEHHTLDRLASQRFLVFEDLEHVPGDGFAFTVRVGGEDQLVGAFDGAGDVIEPLLRLGVDLPEHAEIGIWIDRSGLRRQVSHMAKGGHDLVVAAQICIDRFCFGGRFYEYKLHGSL
jgi:hypothetical protein